MTEAVGKMTRWMRWGPAACGLACLVAAGVLERRPRADDQALETSTVASEAGHALLGDLQVGERIAGWSVLGIRGPAAREAGPGWVRVDLGRDGLRFSVTVAPLGARPEGAPRTTDHYALYYGHPHPRGAQIPEGATRAILAALERRVRAAEGTVRLPGADTSLP